jgi:hypothetical protein
MIPNQDESPEMIRHSRALSRHRANPDSADGQSLLWVSVIAFGAGVAVASVSLALARRPRRSAWPRAVRPNRTAGHPLVAMFVTGFARVLAGRVADRLVSRANTL